jgi:hypothetical protein
MKRDDFSIFELTSKHCFFLSFFGIGFFDRKIPKKAFLKSSPGIISTVHCFLIHGVPICGININS